MGTVATIPGAAGGAVTGQANLGKPVPGNTMGLNQFSPINSASGGTPTPVAVPGGAAGVTGTPPPGTAGLPFFQAPGSNIQALGTTPGAVAGQVGPVSSTATQPQAPVSSATTNADGNPNANVTAQQNKQLTDIYGQGTGSLLSGLIGNLGSNDSSYMQAYSNAMAKQTAEGQSTIATGLGNAGISANSSVSAIENADYLSGVTSQEGLQEQQLLQTQQQEEIGLVQGIQGASAQETGTSWLTDLGQGLEVAGTVAGDVLGTGGLSSLSSLIPGGGGAAPNITSGAAQQLPNVYGGGAPAMPSGIPGANTPNLPGLDF